LRELGSRFFAHAAPARSEEQAKELLAALARRYPDATHVVFAWRLGWPPAERAADAGEPTGTAGAPILAALRGANLSDVVVAVARYFGGTKLGKGGLVRAYGGVAREAIGALATDAVTAMARLEVRAPYERIGALKRLVRGGRVELIEEEYGAAARFLFAVALDGREAFEAALADLALAATERTPGH